MARTNGGEWAGPCPLCGGRDRFRIWPNPSKRHPRAWCRQCGVSGDALAWATRFAGRDPADRGATAATLREAGYLESGEWVRNPVSKVSNSATSPAWPAWAWEHFEERAAIQEFDGGLTRAEAERQARTAVEGLIARGGSRG
jgi:hypothetical protein